MVFPEHIIYRLHAVRRMFQRNISDQDVQNVLQAGKIITSYLDDKPYPSFLILGWCKNRPIHVVVAKNDIEQQSIVITVYEPSLEEWAANYTQRRSQ